MVQETEGVIAPALGADEVPPSAEEPTAEEAPTEPRAESIDDLKAQIEAAEARAAKAEQKLSSIEGSVRKQAERDRLLDDLARETKRQRAALNLLLDQAEPDADAETLRQRRQELSKEEAESQQQARLVRRGERLYQSILRKAKRVGANPADARFAEAIAVWERGRATGNLDDLEEAEALFDDLFESFRAEQQEAAKKQSEREKLDEARRKGKMAVDTGKAAAGAGAGDQELVNKMARGDPMTAEEIVRAGKALDRGIYAEAELE